VPSVARFVQLQSLCNITLHATSPVRTCTRLTTISASILAHDFFHCPDKLNLSAFSKAHIIRLDDTTITGLVSFRCSHCIHLNTSNTAENTISHCPPLASSAALTPEHVLRIKRSFDGKKTWIIGSPKRLWEKRFECISLKTCTLVVEGATRGGGGILRSDSCQCLELSRAGRQSYYT
jgi:hypothetical protein